MVKTRRTRRAKTPRRRVRHSRRRVRHRGGADHKIEIIELLTSAPNWEQALAFFQSMDTPAWHGQYPMVKDDKYYLLIHNGNSDEDEQQKLMLVTLTKTDDAFTSVSIDIMDDKKVSDVRGQIPEDATQFEEYQSDVYKGIRDASLDLFGVGA